MTSYVQPSDFPTSYQGLAPAIAGLRFGDGETVTRIVSDAANFGDPAWVDEGVDGKAFGTKGNATTPHLLGIFLRTQSQGTNLPGANAGGSGYVAQQPANIAKRGEVWVNVDRAVTSGKPAYLNGNVWTTVATAGAIETPYIYRSSTTAAGLARVEVISAPAIVAI